MSRNGSGTYTLPAGNPVVTGTTIETSWANNTLSDIASALTDSLSRSGQGGMTSAFRAADGTNSVPGVSFSNETTTGLYRAGSADLRMAVTTTQVQQWLSTGSVINGTLSATGNVSFDGGSFTFNEAGADKDARFEGDTDANLLVTDASTDRVGVGTATPSNKLTVNGNADVTGDVGIGTSTPTSKLDVYGAINPRITVSSAAGTAPGFTISQTGQTSVAIFQPASSSDLVFFNSSERFRVGSAGQLGIGGANYGTSGQALVSQGVSAAPQWATVGDVTLTGTQTLTNKTLTDPAIIGTVMEDVFTITDGAAFEVDPGNGSIQLITLGANRTPKATNFAAGEAVTLMVDDGSAYQILWTDATWGGSGVVWKTNSGNAPALNTSGYTVIQLWKVGSQVYGARVGNA